MKKAYVKYILALLLFGSNGIVASHISMDSWDIVFLRTMIGSLLLLAIFFVKNTNFHVGRHKRDFLFIVLSGVAMGTGWLFLYEAYRQIGVGIASLLYYCGPVIVMILSPLIFREKLTAPKIVGFCIVLAGLVLVNGKSVMNGGSAFGLFCGGVSSLMYFLMITLNKQATHITGTENACIQLLFSFLTVAVFIGFRQQFVLSIPLSGLPWIFGLGIFNTGLGCYLYFSSLSDLPEQTVAVCGYLEPLTAVILSALLLHEKMTWIQIVGAVCILGGAMLGELWKMKPSKVKPDSDF